MMHGGARKGAGRKPLGSEIRGKTLTFTLTNNEKEMSKEKLLKFQKENNLSSLTEAFLKLINEI